MSGVQSCLARMLWLLVAAALLASTANAVEPVRYRVTPVLTDGELTSLAVEVRFRGHADGRTKLYLPDSWGGQQRLWEEMRDLRAQGAALVSSADPSQPVLEHRPSAPITLRYRIVARTNVPPVAGDGNPARPVIVPDWFFAIGNAVFLFPETERPDAPDRPPAMFEWGRLPRGWRAASDLDHGRMGRRLTIDDVAASLLIGGADLRVISAGQTRIAMRGAFSFTDDALAQAVGAVQRSQRNFWGESEAPYFIGVVPLTPTPGLIVRGGTGRGDGFALYLATDVSLPDVLFLLAHEQEHTWIPNLVGGVPEGESEADSWFGEGFAEFYAARTLRDAGIWSRDDFVRWWNTALFNYAVSPVRTAANARIREAYWTDQALRDLPYQRGTIIAAYADQRARAATGGRKSLDDVMRRMRELARTERRPAVQLFAPAFQLETGLDISRDIERLAIAGEEVMLPSNALGPEFVIRTLELPSFDRGFDAAQTVAADGVVAGVDPRGPAFAAGLRNGMRIVRREGGAVGDSRAELVYRVDDSGQERIIRYLPRGRGEIALQEVVVAPSL